MSAVGAEAAVDFDRDIRPILSDHCYACHGPDAETREADLRLDTKEGALGERDGGVAFLSSKPEESLALERIFADDPIDRMPPPEAKLDLSDEQKQLLKQWVLEGATWGEHWAFEKLRSPQLPTVGDSTWPRNEIDHFVLAQIREAGLEPSPEASRETLIRRVTLDLTGLPPTPQEVETFLADKSPDAYEKLVDRLLASPRYGERMAWDWLDAARYADTDGFQGDPTRTMWPWRDWLIGALNDNMPFDQFTVEMLAGDLLPAATPEQIIASGFNRNHMYNGEGGRISEETRVENVFDRTETTSTVWLGLTMTCARCHDHKFDPIAQREYYGLYAFFNNTSESGKRGGGKAPPTYSYLTPEKRETLNRHTEEIAALEKRLDGPLPEVDAAQKAWETAMREKLAALSEAEPVTLSRWSLLGPFQHDAKGEELLKIDFGPESGVDLSASYGEPPLAWRQDQELPDGKVHALPETVGASYLFRTLTAPGERTVRLSLGSDDGIKVWLNGNVVLAKNVNRGAAADQEFVTLDLQPGDNPLLLKIANTGGAAGFYFQKVAETVGGVTPELAEILLTADEKRNEKQRAELRDFYRERNSEQWRDWQKELKANRAQREQLEKTATVVMVMDELPADQRRETAILSRGLYNKPLETVEIGTPAFLPPLPESAPRNRLTLARWLVDPANPLTARVTVNRYWQTFFGAGLVKTTEDFGRQGDRPSHPQLLDWLAQRFISSGWDVKALHKTIVMSATYRQSSRVTPELLTQDTDNRLLARGARYRMPSWMLRDQALAVSGLLNERIGGPSVKTYQPAGIWAEATFGKIRYQQDKGEKLYRRSLYVFWRRIVGPTMFFDSGKRQTCEVKPARTNTPLHALTTLNETTFVEASRKLAGRILSEENSTEERIRLAYRYVTAREPTEEEAALLNARLERLRKEFTADPQRAEELLSVGASEHPRDYPFEEHAAYTVICSLLLNLDEALTRE